MIGNPSLRGVSDHLRWPLGNARRLHICSILGTDIASPHEMYAIAKSLVENSVMVCSAYE